ncbi:hypothetical protein ACFL2H_06305, partial [Planctomycetota bacterium]
NLELLKKRREAIEQDEMRLSLAEQDLATRRLEIEGILKQSQNTVVEAEKMIVQLQTQLQTLQVEKEAAKAAPETEPVTSAEDVQANTKISAGWLAMMPAPKAAESIKSLVNDGKKDLVLQLFSHLEDRVVAKILSDLEDKDLVAEITHSFQTAKRPTKKKRK